jgi:hypothetical protein
METIYIFTPTIRKSGRIRLRFRLADGRKIQLYHKSDIIADISDLPKFDIYGQKLSRKVLSRPQLEKEVKAEMALMSDVYREMRGSGQPLNSESFEMAIDRRKHPEKSMRAVSMLQRFERYIEDGHTDRLFGNSRYKNYKSTYRKLERFLTITGQRDLAAVDFSSNLLMAFRDFVLNEYQYVDKWRGLYTIVNERDIPRERRGMNTCSGIMKQLQSFFSELENRNEIAKNPFSMLGKERKRAVMKTMYDMPICLQKDEFMKVLEADVPAQLEETRAAFVLQCSLGCRIGDFKALTMANVSVSDEGIPYVHYLPSKTKKGQADNAEVETPILRFALDIIKRHGLKFNILNYASGQSGYNAKIRELLKYCGIDRNVTIYDDSTGQNTYLPLYERGSSKLARKTYVDMMAKVQVNIYASGLHKAGSDAAKRYVDMEMKDRFALACAAFGQPIYHADKDLNIINPE